MATKVEAACRPTKSTGQRHARGGVRVRPRNPAQSRRPLTGQERHRRQAQPGRSNGSQAETAPVADRDTPQAAAAASAAQKRNAARGLDPTSVSTHGGPARSAAAPQVVRASNSPAGKPTARKQGSGPGEGGKVPADAAAPHATTHRPRAACTPRAQTVRAPIRPSCNAQHTACPPNPHRSKKQTREKKQCSPPPP